MSEIVKMKLFGLLLLSAHLCFGDLNAASNQSVHHYVQRYPIGIKFTIFGGWDLSVGDTVVITCKVISDRHKQADKAKLQLVWTKPGDNSTTVVVTETASKGISYTLSPVTYEHRGIYSCRNDGSNPDIVTLDLHDFVWVKDPSASVSVEVISVNRVKYFKDKTVTIGCRVPDDTSQWKIMRCHDIDGIIEECPGQVKKENVVSCTFSGSDYSVDMPYWCQSAAGQMSNVLNVTDAVIQRRRSQEEVATFFDAVRPAWYLRTGDSAVLNCSVTRDTHRNSNNMDLQLIWTQLVNEENNMTVLLSQRASQGFSYSLKNVTHEHSGVYTCWDDGTLPNVSVDHIHRFVWVETDSPLVTINVVSPKRTQFFSDEKVTIGCQLPNDQSQWKIKWFDLFTQKINYCRDPELSPSRFLSCTRNMIEPWYHKLFWCESSTGEKSNLLNTTTAMGNIILEAPTLPVTEGDDVTLRCLKREERTKKITHLNAVFHVNYRSIGASKKGTVTIKGIRKADEGIFQCSTHRQGMGYKTWVTVNARA